MAFLISSAIVLGCRKGDPGPAGTANVFYSDWSNTAPWIASTTSTGSGKETWYLDIAEPRITQDIVDKGAVLVYAKFVGDPDGDLVKALPSTYYDNGSTLSQYHFQYAVSPGKVRIICDVMPAGKPANTNQIRYIVIPGGILID